MSVITPAFTSLTSFGSLSEDSRKFQSEVDQLWADMQASVFKTRAHESPKVPSDKEAKEPAKETKEDPTEKAGRQSPKEATTSFSEMEDLWPGRNTSIFHLRPSISKDEIRSTATAADGPFKVCVPVTGFKPEELSVKLVDRDLVIEAQHEEKDAEKGQVRRSQQMQRRFHLPAIFDADALTSSLSKDGVLTVTAPRKVTLASLAPSPIQIKIEQSQPSATQAQ